MLGQQLTVPEMQSGGSLAWITPVQVTTSSEQKKGIVSETSNTSLSDILFEALAAYKIRTSHIAMHLDVEWRSRFFGQLDRLFSLEAWELDDRPPVLGSFDTMIGAILVLDPVRRPGIGTDWQGNFVAMWNKGSDSLHLECLPGEVVKWHMKLNSEKIAGQTGISKLKAVIDQFDVSGLLGNGG